MTPEEIYEDLSSLEREIQDRSSLDSKEDFISWLDEKIEDERLGHYFLNLMTLDRYDDASAYPWSKIPILAARILILEKHLQVFRKKPGRNPLDNSEVMNAFENLKQGKEFDKQSIRKISERLEEITGRPAESIRKLISGLK